jgi:nitrite reductase/ring-hydroxylating ferredoxin subunit/DMSO/TMAO reductase YedYZ heme-binding membrane subunit
VSHAYRAVQWNRQKRIYDATAVLGVALYLSAFVGLGGIIRPQATIETLLIRGFGTAALLLLHVILSIGPLCRLDPRFLPLLYNRRHLGVLTFLLASTHAGIALVQFHAFGDLHPLVSLLASSGRLSGLADFPFQPLGFAALIILFVMAATSHDFWLANLTAPVWKSLHMLVYPAYGLLILHVVLGVLQAETHPALAGLLACGFVWVVGLHVVSGFRERGGDRPLAAGSPSSARAAGSADGSPGRATSVGAPDGFVRAGAVGEIREKRARIVCLAGERVAIFRYDGKISAVSNVCQHQNGPLGEGKIADGCITCPWHGYQYVPETGASPPPFTEKVPTFRVRVHDGEVWVDPRPLAPGTRVEPARIDAGGTREPA